MSSYGGINHGSIAVPSQMLNAVYCFEYKARHHKGEMRVKASYLWNSMDLGQVCSMGQKLKQLVVGLVSLFFWVPFLTHDGSYRRITVKDTDTRAEIWVV